MNLYAIERTCDEWYRIAGALAKAAEAVPMPSEQREAVRELVDTIDAVGNAEHAGRDLPPDVTDRVPLEVSASAEQASAAWWRRWRRG